MFDKPRSRLLVATLSVAMLCSGAASARAAKPAAYGENALKFTGTKLLDNGAVEITFSSTAETLYYCPGANAKTTKNGIELTFVRSFLKAKPKVTYPAVRVASKENEGTQMKITVARKSQKIFLRDGDKLLKLFPPKKK